MDIYEFVILPNIHQASAFLMDAHRLASRFETLVTKLANGALWRREYTIDKCQSNLELNLVTSEGVHEVRRTRRL